MAQFSDIRPGSMGREEWGTAGLCVDKSIALFCVRFVDGDYDDGGAYWGGGKYTKPLYCARDDDMLYQRFARARNRGEAARLLGIPAAKLKRPTNKGVN